VEEEAAYNLCAEDLPFPVDEAKKKTLEKKGRRW
jgi:hypothetical protein